MSKKSKRPKNSPFSNPNDQGSSKESTKRHVYVEPGVKIDFVQDFREKYESSQSDATTHNRKVLFWSKLGAFLVLIYVGITGWQGWLLRQSVRNSVEQFNIDERPWLKIVPGDPPIDKITPGTEVLGTLQITNTGKSLALRPFFAAGAEIVDSNNAPTLNWEKIHFTSPMPEVFPNDTIPKPYPFSITRFKSLTPGDHDPVTDEEARKLNSGEAYYVIFAKVTYWDAHGISHWTQFCMWYNSNASPPNAAFRARKCTDYNSVDTNYK